MTNSEMSIIYVAGIVLALALNILYQRSIHPTGKILDELTKIRQLLEKEKK